MLFDNIVEKLDEAKAGTKDALKNDTEKYNQNISEIPAEFMSTYSNILKDIREIINPKVKKVPKKDKLPSPINQQPNIEQKPKEEMKMDE